VNGATNFMFSRLKGWMKRSPAMLVAVLGIVLAMGVIACPLWMSLASENTSCTKHSNLPEQCPMSICQISAPYLAPDVSADVVLPSEWVNGAVSPVGNAPLPTGTIPVRLNLGSPPHPNSPLFIQTHSLLI
jgi:hypothetical protein